MKVRFYKTFSKRKNSTKQITSESYDEIDLTLKEMTSIETPVFLLTGDKFDYNYCYIADWERYYFVGDISSSAKGLSQISLIEDDLASHKTEIGNTVAQVVFSSSGYDTWKVDHRLATKVTKTITSSSDTPGVFNGTGCFLLTVINDKSYSGMTSQYVVDEANLRNLATTLFTNAGLKQELKEYCNAPFDAILSCKWLPFSASETPGFGLDTIYLGITPTTSQGRLLSSPAVRSSSVTLSIPWTYNDFRRSEPFTTLNAWLPGYGYVTLSASDLLNGSSIKFDFMCDFGTGDICCNIIDAVSGDIFQSISYNVAVEVPVSNITLDIPGIVNNTTEMLGNAANTALNIGSSNIAGAISGGFSTASAGIGLALAANKRVMSVKGSVGGRATIAEGIDVELYCFSLNTENPDAAAYIARWGRPVGITHAISNHSGYVQCDGASVDGAMFDAERDTINAYLNSGFYYE